MSNAIITENQNSGTTAWVPASVDTTQIAGYCDAVAYNPGDTVTFYISTQVNATTFTLTIYRMGYYSGTGACLKHTSPLQTGVAQGYYDGATLQNCPTAIIDSTTHSLEAGWTSSYTWAIPSNACTGVYLVMLVDANGKRSYMTFVVRSATATDYLYIRPVNTDQAYNDWGGYSLYTNPTVGTKVSFNRPNTKTYGTGWLLNLEVPGIKWMESQGYSLAYLTNTDVHSNAAQLLQYKAILSAGHDEYWTKAMRDGVEAAIAAKVSAAFLCANASYWQCRYENDHAGNTNRTLVCYKVSTSGANLSLDPQYGVNNAVVTSQWRDAVLGRPENTMIGIMYSSFVPASNFNWTVSASAPSTYLSGTGLTNGASYGSDLVGFEYDKIQSGGPSNLQTLGTTSVLNSSSQADTSNTTYYVAPSGALVFASGSHSWTWALDSFRTSGSVATIPGIQYLFARIMGALKGPVFSMVGV